MRGLFQNQEHPPMFLLCCLLACHFRFGDTLSITGPKNSTLPPELINRRPDDDGSCKNEGFYPTNDEKDCAKFYQCVLSANGQCYDKFEFQCGSGTMYHPNLTSCVYPWQMPQDSRCSPSSSECGSPVQKSCNSEVKENNTYFVNPGWPEPFDGSIECPIIVQKMDSNVCQYRLDFKELSLSQPEPGDHICESDVFAVKGGRPTPPICGENAGQHMYIDAGSSSNNIPIDIVTSRESMTRRWRIKISQISCNAAYRATDSCLQYHTGVSGKVKSFNFGDPQIRETRHYLMQLSAQEYSICIRADEGFCGILYVPCEDSKEVFQISSRSQNESVSGSDQCSSDWLGISCATDTGRQMQTDGSSCVDRICGGVFASLSGSKAHAPVYSFIRPFSLFVHFNDCEMSDPRSPDGSNRGFCLNYVQQPCPQNGVF